MNLLIILALCGVFLYVSIHRIALSPTFHEYDSRSPHHSARVTDKPLASGRSRETNKPSTPSLLDDPVVPAPSVILSDAAPRREWPSRGHPNAADAPAHFYCEAPKAREVYLVGDFNGWNPRENPMHKQTTGAWTLELPLHVGHHQYYFVVDGKQTLDPRAMGSLSNQRGDRVSLMAVS